MWYCLNMMNRLKKSLIPIKTIERVSKKSKKNTIDKKYHLKSPSNDIIISNTLLAEDDENVLKIKLKEV